MKPGVGAGLCNEDGKLAEFGVGSGEGRGFVDVAAAIAFADAEALSIGAAGEALMTSAARMNEMYVGVGLLIRESPAGLEFSTREAEE